MKGYMNLKIKNKLMLAFMILALFSIVIGIIGTVSINMLRQEDQAMYEENTTPISKLAALYDIVGSQRVRASNMVIFYQADPEFSAAETAKLADKEAEFEEVFASYGETISPDSLEERAIYDAMANEYFVVFAPIKAELRRIVAAKDAAAMPEIIRQVNSMGSIISGYVDEAVELNMNIAANKVAANQKLATTAGIVQGAALLLGLAFAVFCALFLSNIISRPMGRIMAITRQAGESGNLNFSEEQMASVQRDAQYLDETGLIASAFISMMDNLTAKIHILERVAKGDLSMKVHKIGDQDTLGDTIEDMTSNLNNMFREIKASTGQVSIGVGQIASGAQSLAQASAEQSSVVESLSISIREIADKTKHNASIAREAADLSGAIKGSAEKGSTQMDQMMQAVKDISDASNQIEKVIKVIDDIAFQTNILALNAAVEAARAGAAGKGFAVVAEEVRNLAAKSAAAAKDTGSLIENSVAKAKLGLNIATNTSTSLQEIVEGINRSAEIAEQIATSSDAQAEAIVQIDAGIDQVAQVVQQNSATAEQNSAASEQMNSQADMLQKMISRFQLQSQPHAALPEAGATKDALALMPGNSKYGL